MTTHGPFLGAVQETLLIPLYGRAVEHHKKDAALRDERAAEIVAALSYDFGRFNGLPSLVGTALRTVLFDRWVRAFLSTHPSGTNVEIGTGLNTRYERVDNGRARSLLPQTRVLPDRPSRRRRAAPSCQSWSAARTRWRWMRAS
ncbi:hypothetical protein ACFWV1_25470 [Streptomyces sp. NPDC058700]|uniref:hypothetical protein n=1 Tax=Streptomyces sp. NPDC058700 TaxID=3346607 RepID=UPI00364F4552